MKSRWLAKTTSAVAMIAVTGTATICPAPAHAGVPLLHRTDRMTAAVNNLTEQADFQQSYQALLRHYGLDGRKIQTGRPNENGDVEQRHYRFRRALEQALLLRGSRDFSGVEEYRAYLGRLFEQLNGGRKV
jgi:hypothetical protein